MIPRYPHEAWTIQGAVYAQRRSTGQTLDATEREISELEQAAHDDWFSLGATSKERRRARVAEVGRLLTSVGAKPHVEKPQRIKRDSTSKAKASA